MRGSSGAPHVERHPRGVYRTWRRVPRLISDRSCQARDDELLSAGPLILRSKPLDEQSDLGTGVRKRHILESVFAATAYRNQQPQIDESAKLRRLLQVREVMPFGLFVLLIEGSGTASETRGGRFSERDRCRCNHQEAGVGNMAESCAQYV